MKWLLLCAVLILGLTACDSGADGADPATTFSPSASAPETHSSSAPPRPAEPTLPTAATNATKAGAEAFVRYYWDVVNYAQKTGDTTTLRSLQLSSCTACTGGTKSIDDIYMKGGRITGGAYRVIGIHVSVAPSGHGYLLVSTSVEVGTQRVRGAGALNTSYPAGRSDVVLTVHRKGGHWVVSSWSVA